MSSQLLGRPCTEYATAEGDSIDGCTTSSRGTMYIAPLVEIGRNSVHDRMNCAEEVPSSCGLLLHLISRATGRS